MAKKKDASTGSADASVLRKSDRDTASRKQTTSSPLSSRKSEGVNKHTSPSPSQIGSSPLRRSDRGKKSVEMPDVPNIKSTREENLNNSKQSSEDVNKDERSEKQDPDIGDRKRKRFTAVRYKATFKPQRIRIESDDDEDRDVEDKSPQVNTSRNAGAASSHQKFLDVDKELKSQNNTRVREVLDKEHKAFLEGRVIDLDQIEHGDCPQTQSLVVKSIGSGDMYKENGDNVILSNGNIANNDNHMSHTSSYRIEHDLENQLELDTCHTVIETRKATGIMEDTEKNDVSSNMQNSKFVEFWVPIPLSNVQLEQYCATLLSNAMALGSSVKSDTLGALKDILTTNRKCCNHPYIVDRKIHESLMKNKGPRMILDVDIEASGKLQFLDHVLPVIQKQQLRVLILFQPTSGVLSGFLSLGEILVDFVHGRFGQNSYEHVDGIPNISSKKQAAINMFNKDMTKFIFLLESRACHLNIKLSSVDAIIIFDSELNPSNDLKSLQKLSLEPQLEQIMIFRLYSSSTLEEKILKLAENNVAVDIRSPNLRSNYDSLLTWGASNLFDKLTEFHRQNVLHISSEASFLEDVVKEFLYILSHKCKSNETTAKFIITRIQNCGIYGRNTPLHSEVKTHLSDGDQPYIFWKKLLEGRCPAWKFVSESTPRQRKRSNYFLEGKSGVDGGVVKTRRKTVNNSTIEANESQSLSGDQFWSATVNDETCPLDLLKPTVSELCDILKFSEDVKITVVRFLEYVVEKYNVVEKDNVVENCNVRHSSALQALVISLCCIGSSLAKVNVDRSEFFALAKKHLNFICTEGQIECVDRRLEEVKKEFLETTPILPALKECVPAPERVKLGIEKSQLSNENVSRKGVEAFEKINTEWHEKKLSLENDFKEEKLVIDALYHNNPSMRSEQLKIIERELDKKLEEQKRLQDIRLKELNATMRAGDGSVMADNNFSLHGSQHETREVHSGNREVAPTLPETTIEAESHDEPVCEGANDIESTGSHTSEKELVDVAASSEQIGVPAQQHGDDMEVDVAEKFDFGHENAEGGTSCPDASYAVGNHNETGSHDMAPHVDRGDVEMPAGNDNKEVDEDATVGLDENDHIETGSNDMAPRIYSGDMPMPAGNDEEENEEGGTVGLDESDHNETGANDMVPHVDSGNMGTPAGNYNKENDGYVIVGFNTSYIVKDPRETVDDVAPQVICNDESPEEGEILSDSLDVDDHNETSPNDMLSSGESAEMETPADNEENAEDSIVRPDALRANEDHNVNVSCGSNNSNPGCAAISQDKSPSVQPVSSPASDHLEPIIPDSGVQDEEIDVGNLQPSGVGQLDEPDFPPSTDPVCAGISQYKTPPVQPVSCPASDHVEPIFPESQNDPIQLEQLPDTGVQDEENNVANLQPSSASQLYQIIPDEPDFTSSTVPMVVENLSDTLPPSGSLFQESQNDPIQLEQLPDTGVQNQDEENNVANLQPSSASQLYQIIPDEPDFTPSTVPMVVENLSDTLPPSGSLLEPIGEETAVPQSGENLEGNPVPASETPHEEQEHQPGLVTSSAPAPLINALNMFDNLTNRMSPQMSIHANPLQAEVERLKMVKDNVTKLYQETKQFLNTECDKEIEEAVAQIRLKYEAKHVEADAAYNSKNLELVSNINRVSMNKKLADAFRSKCQDLTPSGHPVSPAGIMQQLQRMSVSPSMWHYHSASSSSPGQSSGNQQPQQPPPSQPLQQPQLRPQLPLQIVNQPAALFSSTLSRPPSIAPTRPPFSTSSPTTPSRPPPVVSQLTSSTPPTTSRQLPTRSPPIDIVNQVTPSTTPTTSRPPSSIVNQVTPSTTSGPPPIVNQVTPSTTPTTSRPPPIVNQATASTTPTTSRPPSIVNQVTPSTTPTTSRPPPGINMSSLSALHKRSPPSNSQIDMSAANLRISTETRGQSPHIRPMAGSETRGQSPHIRPGPLVSSERRAPPPHLRPSAIRELRAPAPHLRAMASTEIRARAPHIQPFRPTPSLSPDVGTHRRVQPSQHVASGPSQSTAIPQRLPSESYNVPLSPPSARTPSLPSDNLNGLADNAPRWVNVTAPQPDLRSQNGRLDVTDFVRESTVHSSSTHDLVCLSDDD